MNIRRPVVDRVTYLVPRCSWCSAQITGGGDDGESPAHVENLAELLQNLRMDPDEAAKEENWSRDGWIGGMLMPARPALQWWRRWRRWPIAVRLLGAAPTHELVCMECAVVAICAERGHRYDEWMRLCPGDYVTDADGRRHLEPHPDGEHTSRCREDRRCERDYCRGSRQTRPLQPAATP